MGKTDTLSDFALKSTRSKDLQIFHLDIYIIQFHKIRSVTNSFSKISGEIPSSTDRHVSGRPVELGPGCRGTALCPAPKGVFPNGHLSAERWEADARDGSGGLHDETGGGDLQCRRSGCTEWWNMMEWVSKIVGALREVVSLSSEPSHLTNLLRSCYIYIYIHTV